jgi:2-dehydro-3-deoxy-D-arabinonate dehydratase
MKLYNTTRGILVTDNQGQQCATLDSSAWDVIIAAPDLFDRAQKALAGPCVTPPAANEIVAPIGTQEVWAAGVTYYRSRSARIEESKDAGGGTFYDRVYSAERPELFFKATARRVIGPGGNIRIRTDATWSVPEPELTLVINPNAEIVGYTIGNDMSSRDIEGENPLYLPQAKVYDGSCALGPCVLLADVPLPKSTAIAVTITRKGGVVFTGSTSIAEIKREFNDLVSYLFRDNTFPTGACLMTGTGVVPEDDFTLAHNDVVTIVIDGIGTLSNTVA